MLGKVFLRFYTLIIRQIRRFRSVYRCIKPNQNFNINKCTRYANFIIKSHFNTLKNKKRINSFVWSWIYFCKVYFDKIHFEILQLISINDVFLVGNNRKSHCSEVPQQKEHHPGRLFTRGRVPQKDCWTDIIRPRPLTNCESCGLSLCCDIHSKRHTQTFYAFNLFLARMMHVYICNQFWIDIKLFQYSVDIFPHMTFLQTSMKGFSKIELGVCSIFNILWTPL